MITRRRTLAAIAAAIITPFVSTEAHAAPTQPPGRRPPPKRPPMYDVTVIRKADNLILLPPIYNQDGSTPDYTKLSAKCTVLDAPGGSAMLDDIDTAGGFITLMPHPSGTGLGVRLYWNVANSIAHGSQTQPVVAIGDVHLKVTVAGILPLNFITTIPLRVTILPGETTG